MNVVAEFVLSGPPRTKKNHQQLVRGTMMAFPSAAWRKWARNARFSSEAGPALKHLPAPAITQRVNCRALFYRDALRGDAVGYYQGLADLLEEREVLEDDKLIVSWDGSRMLIDRKNPRTEVTLETCEEE